jgi:hypothetical protein
MVYHVPEMYLLPEMLSRARMRRPHSGLRPAKQVAMEARRRRR